MKNYFILIFIFLSFSLNSQSEDSKWTFGASLGSALYSDIDGNSVGSIFIDQPIRFNISRYMFKNITFDAAIATSIIDNNNYTTFDGILRYDFGTSYDNVVPYLLLGGSFISAAQLTPTLNFGAGNTFWIFPNYGLNLQVMYKFSEAQFSSQYSHLYPTIGIVYSFKSRNMNRRLWHMKH